MIVSFKHKGLEKFYTTGSKAGIQPGHAPGLARQLTELAIAEKPSDLAVGGLGPAPAQRRTVRLLVDKG